MGSGRGREGELQLGGEGRGQVTKRSQSKSSALVSPPGNEMFILLQGLMFLLILYLEIKSSHLGLHRPMSPKSQFTKISKAPTISEEEIKKGKRWGN